MTPSRRSRARATRHGDTFVVEQRRRPLSLHLLPHGCRVVLRAARGGGEQGRRRLSDAAAQASRRDLRRQARPSHFLVSPRRRRVIPRQPALGAEPDGDRTGIRWLGGPFRPHPQARAPDGAGVMGGTRIGRRGRLRAAGVGVRHAGRLGRVRPSRRDGRRRRVGQAVRACGAGRGRRCRVRSCAPVGLPIASRSRQRAVRPDRRGLVVGRRAVPDPRHRTRRRADPHRIDVESDGRTRLGDGRPPRTPGRTRGRRRRRQRAGAAMRAGEHAAGAAFDHVAGGAGAGRPRYRRCHVSGARGLDHRHTAAAAEHVGRARSGALGSGTLASVPARRCGCVAVADAGDGVRPRSAHLPGAAVLPGRDDHGDDPPARPLPDDAAAGAATLDPSPNRSVAWRERQTGARSPTPSGDSVPSRCSSTLWRARSSSAGCRAARVRRRHPSGTGATARPEGGSAAPGRGTG